MSLQQEHQEWQEEKIRQALDRSYDLIQERSKASPQQETFNEASWCLTRGSVVSTVLGQVPRNLQGLVKDLRDKIEETSKQTSTELLEKARERMDFPQETIDVIINNNQGIIELVLPIKDKDKDSNGLCKRIYAGCLSVLENLRLRGETNSYQGYVVITTDALDNKRLPQNVKEDLDARLISYKLTTSVAGNFSFEHDYDNPVKPRSVQIPTPRVRHDPKNRVITVNPPGRNGKARFLPIPPDIKSDIVNMIKDGKSYESIRDEYKNLADQGQLPDSRLQCFKSHITMKTY